MKNCIANMRDKDGKLPVTVGVRTLQYKRGYDDAVRGVAYGHSSESKSYNGTGASAAYRAGWEDGRSYVELCRASGVTPLLTGHITLPDTPAPAPGYQIMVSNNPANNPAANFAADVLAEK